MQIEYVNISTTSKVKVLGVKLGANLILKFSNKSRDLDLVTTWLLMKCIGQFLSLLTAID